MLNIKKLYKTKREDVIIFIKNFDYTYYVQGDDAIIVRMFSDYKLKSSIIYINGDKISQIEMVSEDYQYVSKKLVNSKICTLEIQPESINQTQRSISDKVERLFMDWNVNKYTHYLERAHTGLNREKHRSPTNKELKFTKNKLIKKKSSKYNDQSTVSTPNSIRSGSRKGRW